MQTHEIRKEIIDSLSNETAAGKVNWRFHHREIVATVDGAMYVMWSEQDGQWSARCIVLGVTDGAWSVTDAWMLEAGDLDFPSLNALYQAAHHDALSRVNAAVPA
ncbi:MAG: hypothetical protein ABW202_14615 [Duganella sp.]